MGDQLAREDVDARKVRRGPVGQLRQLEVVLTRQVLANLADLILDDVVIVAQPVFRADDGAFGRRGFGEELVGGVQLFGRLVEPRQQRQPAHRFGGQAVEPGQPDGVTFQLVLAEELRRCRASVL